VRTSTAPSGPAHGTVAHRPLATWLINHSVRTKIMVTLLLLSAVSVGVGVISTLKLNSLQQNTDALYREHTQPIATLYSVQRNYQSVRTRAVQYGWADAENRRTLTSEIAEKNDALQSAITKYRPFVVDAKDFDAFVKDYAAFYDLTTKTMIPAVDAGDPATYRAAYTKTGAPLVSQLLDELQAESDAQAAEAAKHDAEARSEAISALEIVWISLGLGLTAALALGLYVARWIVRPLRGVRDGLVAMARGDLTVQTGYAGRDEVGEMAVALTQAQAAVGDAIGELSASVGTMTRASQQLDTVSDALGASAQDTSTQAELVSESAQQMAGYVQAMSAATEQMSSSISEIAHQAASASDVASEAVKAAGATSEAVSELDTSSSEIGEIVRTITSIAEQTNLLALNATIEAARAGEAGKGFAVVATEVKDLAQETAKATDDITAKISSIQGTTSRAIEAIARISGIIDQIHEKQTTIAAAVEEQSATTAEITRTVTDVAGQSETIAHNISGIATAAEQTSQEVGVTTAAAGELANLATRIQQVVQRFQA